MELSKQYIILDEEKKSDYTVFKILHNLSNEIYSIYHFLYNNLYYFHEPENVGLSISSLKNNFTSLNDIMEFIENKSNISTKTKKENKVVNNIFNLGRKKINIKCKLDKNKLETNICSSSDISEEIPKELLSTPKQIFQMIFHELDKINKNYDYKDYYQPINESIYNLNMFVFNDKVGKFKFEVILDPSAFPLIPPKIRLVEPLLRRDVMLQINNLEDLTIDKWNPTVSLEFLLNKFSEKIGSLKEFINKDMETDIIFEKLNSMLADVCGIKTPKVIEFNLEFHKISLKNNKTSKYWDSGTGYGHEGTRKWDIKSFYKNRTNRDKEKCNILSELFEYFTKNTNKFIKNYEKSIIQKYCSNFINSINILEYLENIDNYIISFKIIEKLIKYNSFSINSKTKKILNNFYENMKNLIKQEDSSDEKIIDFIELVNNVNIKIIVIINIDKLDQSKKEKYEDMVRIYQFSEGDVPSYYQYNKEKYNPSKKAMIRIMTENQSLQSSLPVNWDTSILMRISKDCINYSSVFITGPEGTPYHNGIFEFHMYYPNDYPISNPKINLMTTGNGTVRFNPNLYNCGKVCLSLLGTWRGEEGESWNPKFSTALQLLISVQSLIFIKDPYFNEPGWERDRGTNKGDKNSKEYSELRELETIRWAINDKIINPVKGMEEFTKLHFKMKHDEIIKITENWYNNCTQKKYKSQMKQEIDKMISLFDSLKKNKQILSDSEDDKGCITDSDSEDDKGCITDSDSEDENDLFTDSEDVD